jgi:hypothetical protein
MRGGDRILVVDTDNRLRLRQVEVFRTERDRILIASGIEETDRIVVSPLETAIDGEPVRVAERAPVSETR